MKLLYACLALFFCVILKAQITPEVYSWKLNHGEVGSYYVSGNSTPVSSGIDANVQQVRYSTDNVYINATGIPDYPVGPFLDGNPSSAGEQEYLFRVPRDPQENTGTKTATRLGHIGVFINGVPVYNAYDAMSYGGLGIWNRNAVVMENAGFDCAKGHPAPNMQGGLAQGFYHHHQNPASFSNSADPPSTVCNLYPSAGLYVPDSTQHSPIIGFAFDGFPIYGAYGFSDPNDSQSPIKRIQTSYRKRNITDRTTLPDGTVLVSGEYGPAISGSFPLGAFIEDHEFVQGSGDLDIYNGRFCVTPEYPGGTYAYFASMDADGNSEYPYLIGPEYFGIVATDNFPVGQGGGTAVTVTGTVTVWDGATSAGNMPFISPEKIYPNPVTGVLRLSDPLKISGKQYFIYNTVGETVCAGKFNGEAIEVGALPSGVYYLVVANEKAGRFKFVKQ
jgi:hypothetical protein